MATPKKIQPQDLESEKSLLGAMMISSEAISLIIGKVYANSFYKPSHGTIYEAIVDLYNEHEPIDLLTVSNKLKKEKKLSEIGGRTYLIELTECVPTASNADYYASIVAEKALLRKLITAGSNIIKDAFDETNEPKEVIEEAQQAIIDLSKESFKDNFIHLKEAVNTVFEKIQTTTPGEDNLTGIPTGYPDLDKMTSGFQPGDLVILAARPSMGKTTLALNFAQHMAIQNKVPVAIFSCEMPSEQLAVRLLCSEAKIDSKRMRTSSLKDNEYRDLNLAFGKLSEAPIYIDDAPNLSPLEVKAKFRRLELKVKPEIVIIDYLQLLRGSKKRSESRYHEVSEIVREIKAFAKESNVAVIALSQLSRDIEKRQDKRPMLSDLRESGEIEQTADLIMFIHRNDEVDASNLEFSNVQLVIAKHRNGPTGNIDLGFRKQVSTFVSVMKAPTPQPPVPEPIA
tara:strand:+ start:1739 stop:3103 length:1365 start_codon:yes stop_codon:yes gene_type:complete